MEKHHHKKREENENSNKNNKNKEMKKHHHKKEEEEVEEEVGKEVEEEDKKHHHKKSSKKREEVDDRISKKHHHKKKSGKSNREGIEEKKELVRKSDENGRGTTLISQIISSTGFLHPEPIHIQRSKIVLKSNMIKFFPDGSLPEKTDVWCWWCKHPFPTYPIGLPIKHHKKQNISGYTPDCYETIGVFCSFPCALAFYDENSSNIIYLDSSPLLHQMYRQLFGENIRIQKANHWTDLKEFGGTKSINSFRGSFENDMVVSSNLARMVIQIPVGQIMEIMS